MKTITLNEFHRIVSEAFAVCANDTLYFVGHDDDDCLYVGDDNNDVRIELAEVDGDIEVGESAFFFSVGGEPIELEILNVVNPKRLISIGHGQ